MTETQSDQVDNIRQAWVASEALMVGYEAVLAELVLNAWLIKQAVIVQRRINSKTTPQNWITCHSWSQNSLVQSLAVLEKGEKISIKYDQEKIRCFCSIIIEAWLALKYLTPT